LLKRLSSQVKHEIIAVCGTNGKTTTNNLLCELLEVDGNKVICNKVGANMLPGVACSFISNAKLNGKLDFDYACLECDEASLRHIVKHITPHKIIVTNLFRDQMDRYGETEMTAKLLDEAICKVPDTTLILNADDPLCVSLGKDRKCIYYGIDQDCNNKIE
jgi:UDP-N-acetylmuramate-alanine ligase